MLWLSSSARTISRERAGVKRQSDTPHDARAMRVGERLVLTHQLHGKPADSSGGLHVIMQIEVLVPRSDVPGRPALRNVDEQNVKVRSVGVQPLNRAN